MEERGLVARMLGWRAQPNRRGLVGRTLGRFLAKVDDAAVARLRNLMGTELADATGRYDDYAQALLDVADGVYLQRLDASPGLGELPVGLRAHWRPIMLLLERQPSTPTAISACLGLPSDRVSKLLGAMSAAHLVEYEPSDSDARSKTFSLTARGLVLAANLRTGSPEWRTSQAILRVVRAAFTHGAWTDREMDDLIQEFGGPQSALGETLAAFVNEMETDKISRRANGRWIFERAVRPDDVDRESSASALASLRNEVARGSLLIRSENADRWRQVLWERLPGVRLIPVTRPRLEMQFELPEVRPLTEREYSFLYDANATLQDDLRRPEARGIVEAAANVVLMTAAPDGEIVAERQVLSERQRRSDSAHGPFGHTYAASVQQMTE